MKFSIKAFTLLIGLIIAAPAFAASPTNVFATCLVDNLNGKERKSLAKWIYLAMAAHPEIKPLSSASEADIQKSDKYIGKLITKLLTVDCPSELNTASKSNPRALQNGFGLVGKVAMQELMSNKNVTKALTNYIKYADLDKIKKITRQK